MSEIELSPRGRQRREHILEMAIQQARQRRRRRLAVRGGAAAVVLLVAGLALLLVPHPGPQRHELPVATKSQPPTAPPRDHAQAAKLLIEHIQTDPTLLKRLAVRPSPPRWQTLDDDQLLRELALAGKPAGLVKINGRASLMFHHASN